MATKAPSGASNIWSLPQTWTPTGEPTAADDVVIGANENIVTGGVNFGQDILQAGTILLSDNSASLFVDAGRTLTARTITLAAGTIGTSTTLFQSPSNPAPPSTYPPGTIYNSTLRLQGGTLTGGFTLDFVAVQGTLDLGANYLGTLSVRHRLTLDGTQQVGLRATDAGQLIEGAASSDTGILDGGVAVVGSSSAATPVVLTPGSSNLLLGPGLGLDVTGAARIAGAASQAGYALTNAGTVTVAPGASLQVTGFFSNSGSFRISSGTLDLSGVINAANPYPVRFDDNGGKLLLQAGQSAIVTGFRAGDTIDVLGAAPPTGTGPTLAVSSGALALGGGTITFAGPTAPGATYAAAPDGSGGTLITTTATPAASIAFSDASAGMGGAHAFDTAGAGGPAYLQWQYIDAGPDTVALSAGVSNVFVHGGSGTKAIAVAAGQNVLDGGTGSSFLTGGSGTDTFFVDTRYGSPVNDTVRNFHAGDAVTIWGFVPGVDTVAVDPQGGAAGSEGATLRIGDGTGATVASVTFSGLSGAQVAGLQQATGTQAAGSYLFLYNLGV